MAFNPFSGFRKYQKFWMAMLTLLSMITFVMCMGLGRGGLEDLILGWFGRSRGPEVVQLAKLGRTLYTEDLRKLKRQRNIANDFVRRAMDVSRKGLELRVKENAKLQNEKQRKSNERILNALLADLEELQHRPRYFGGSDQLDDLIDFYLWQLQADKLGIRLEDQQVLSEVNFAVHGDVARMTPNDWYVIQEEVRRDQGGTYPISPSDITEALRQEYRVQAAKMALLKSRPYAFLRHESPELLRHIERRKAPSPFELWEFYKKNRTSADIALVPIAADKFLAQVKEPKPGQLRQELEKLFEDYKNIKYDPASPVPGFISPEEVKITWITADPKSPYYRNLSRLVTVLDQTAPAPWTAALPAPVAALDAAGRSLAWNALLEANYVKRRNDLLGKLSAPLRSALLGSSYAERQQLLEQARHMVLLTDQEAAELFRYLDEPLTEPYSALYLAARLYEKPDPKVVAAMVGVSTLPGPLSPAPVLYQAAAWQQYGKEAAPIAKVQEERRWPIGATLLLSGASPIPPFQTLGMWGLADSEEQFLPFDLVASKFRRDAEERLAIGWTGQVMRAVKPKLEAHRGIGNDMELKLDELQQQYPGLEVHRTKDFRTRFDIAKDPVMKGFLDSFEKYREQINMIEGRSGTERALKRDSFYLLFFGGEPFSVGNTSAYDPKMWPPIVTPAPKRLEMVQAGRLVPLAQDAGQAASRATDKLWRDAAAPILFWKTDHKTEQAPQTLAQARAEVERAWKLAKARDLALPQARKIAEALRKAQPKDGNYEALMEQEAAKLGAHLIILRGVTPLIPERGELAPASWKPYQLPKDVILYPTEDMTKELMELRTLKAPIAIKPIESKSEKTPMDVNDVVKKVNEINANLFKMSAAKGAPQVQILTNRPRTIFYVAVVLKEYPPSQIEFLEMWSDALRRPVPGTPVYLDTIIDRAQQEAGQEFEKRFVQQLRSQAGVGEISAEARKNFETGG
jgi:hypothetical protein